MHPVSSDKFPPMLRGRKGLVYSLACALVVATLACTLCTLTRPWLVNSFGDRIYMSHYCVGGSCYEFPTGSLCEKYPGMCTSWRSSIFVLSLGMGCQLLAALALLASWVFSRRKRMVNVLRTLELGSLVFLSLVLVNFLYLYSQADQVDNGSWEVSEGVFWVCGAIFGSVSLLVLMLRFRELVKGEFDTEDYDSDAEEDLEAVSSDEDVAEDLQDFHRFNKQVRRAALRQLGG